MILFNFDLKVLNKSRIIYHWPLHVSLPSHCSSWITPKFVFYVTFSLACCALGSLIKDLPGFTGISTVPFLSMGYFFLNIASAAGVDLYLPKLVSSPNDYKFIRSMHFPTLFSARLIDVMASFICLSVTLNLSLRLSFV